MKHHKGDIIQCVYGVKSIAFGCIVYVGKTKNFFQRIASHKRGSSNNKICRHIKMFGVNDLRFGIIEVCNDEQELDIKELKWIYDLQPAYNKKDKIDWEMELPLELAMIQKTSDK